MQKMDLSVWCFIWIVIPAVCGLDESELYGCKYKFVLQHISWEEAKQACRQMYKTLINVDDSLEHSYLETFLLPSVSEMMKGHPYLDNAPEFWIALHDECNGRYWENSSRYISEEKYDPAGSGESGCFVYRQHDNGSFRGLNCTDKRMFICEADEPDVNTCMEEKNMYGKWITREDINRINKDDLCTRHCLSISNCYGFIGHDFCTFYYYDYMGMNRPGVYMAFVKDVNTCMEEKNMYGKWITREDINRINKDDLCTRHCLSISNCYGFIGHDFCTFYYYDYMGMNRPGVYMAFVKGLVDTTLQVTVPPPSIDHTPHCSSLQTSDMPSTTSDETFTTTSGTPTVLTSPSLSLESSLPPELNSPLHEFTSSLARYVATTTYEPIVDIALQIIGTIESFNKSLIPVTDTNDTKIFIFDPLPSSCEDVKSYQDWMNQIEQRNAQHIPVASKQEIEKFFVNITAILRTAMIKDISEFIEILCPLLNVINKQIMVSDRVVGQIAESFSLLSEGFTNVISRTNTETICEAPCFDADSTTNKGCAYNTFNAMLYMSSVILDEVVPPDLSQQYQVLFSDTTRKVREYVDFVDLVSQKTENNRTMITECALITPEERTDLFRQQGRQLRFEHQQRQVMIENVIPTIMSSVSKMESAMLQTLCQGCSSDFTTSVWDVLILRNKSSSVNRNTYMTGNVHFSPRILVGNNAEVFLTIKLARKNPWITGNILSASHVTSDIVFINLTKTSGGAMDTDSLSVRFPTTGKNSVVISPEFIPGDASRCHYHVLWYRSTSDKICFHVEPFQTTEIKTYEIYMRQRRFPTHIRFDHFTEMSRGNNWMSCLKPEFIIGPVFLCIRPVVLSVNRRKRDVNGGNDNITDPSSTPFKLTVATGNCLTWNSEGKLWEPNSKCEMEWFPNQDQLQCTCKNVDAAEVAIGNSFYVPANTVSFSTVFLKFSPHDQAAVLGALATIISIYILMCVWSRNKDKQDVIKWGVTPLADNNVKDSYFYLLTVHTGMRINAGTRSDIEFVIAGSDGDTGARRLYDGVRKGFSKGSIVHFLMGTESSLGHLDYIHIWLDQLDTQQADPWYLHRVDIEDLQTQQRCQILCNKWIANDDNAESFEAVFPVSNKEDVYSFKNVLYSNISEHLSDNHLVTSIFWRPHGSSFTRVQRVTCLFLFTVMAMISNAIYFRPEDIYEDPEQFRLGPLLISLRTVYVSLISSLVCTGTVLMVVFLFRKSKGRNENTSPLACLSCRKGTSSKATFMDGFYRDSRELENAIIWRHTRHSNEEILPYFFRYIAWFLSVSGAAVAIFFLLLFSMEWGKQKTDLWLTQFFVSFSINTIVLDQIKMVAMAVMFSILFAPKTKFRSYSSSQFSAFLRTYKQKYSEYSKDLRRKVVCPNVHKSRQEAYEKHKQRQELTTSLKESLLTCVFIWLVANITYGYRDTDSYLVYESLFKSLVHPQQGNLHFDKITGTDVYNAWMQNVALPVLFPEKDIHGEELHWRWRQFLADGVNFRVGPPRLRQLRVRKSSKDYPLMGNHTVYPCYDSSDEDTAEYCVGWGALPCDLVKQTYSYTRNAWRFTSAFDVWGMPIAGIFNTYGGGGYIAELDVNRNRSLEVMEELISMRWIDRYTRAIFFEFTLYSTNTNMFTYVILLAEFPETGGVLTMYNMYVLNTYQYHNAQGTQLLLYEILFLIFVLIFVVRVGIDIHAKGKKYFWSVSRNINFIMLAVSFTCIAIYFARLFIALKTMEMFNTEPKEFLNFYHLVVIDHIFVVVLSILLSLVTLKLLHILEFYKHIEHMLLVWKNCYQVLGTFGLLFWYVLLGYAGLGFLLFGSQFGPFRNLLSASVVLYSYIIGTGSFKHLNRLQPFLVKIYFFFYVLVQSYFLLTILLSIVCDSIATTKQTVRPSKASQLIEFMCELWKKRPFHKGRPKTTKAQLNKQTSIDIVRDLVIDIRKENNTIQGPRIRNNERKKQELARVNKRFRNHQETLLSDISVQI